MKNIIMAIIWFLPVISLVILFICVMINLRKETKKAILFKPPKLNDQGSLPLAKEEVLSFNIRYGLR